MLSTQCPSSSCWPKREGSYSLPNNTGICNPGRSEAIELDHSTQRKVYWWSNHQDYQGVRETKKEGKLWADAGYSDWLRTRYLAQGSWHLGQHKGGSCLYASVYLARVLLFRTLSPAPPFRGATLDLTERNLGNPTLSWGTFGIWWLLVKRVSFLQGCISWFLSINSLTQQILTAMIGVWVRNNNNVPDFVREKWWEELERREWNLYLSVGMP